MQIVGYMILLVFYLCYFIKMFQQRKQGIQTDHMGKGKQGIQTDHMGKGKQGIQTDHMGKGKQGIQKKIEIMMKGATIATFIIEILSIYLNTTTFPLIIRIMGIFLGIIGDIVFIASVLTMKDSWRAGVSYEEKTDLITNGIYQISRNPAFLGFDLVYLGMCLMFFNTILLIISLLAMMMFHLQIKYVEEPFLKQEFKEQYLQYYQQVNCYIGKRIGFK